MKKYFLSSLIALVLILTQSTSIADQCNYRTQTITENGVIVQRTEVKTCEESIDLNKKNFVVEFMTDDGTLQGMYISAIAVTALVMVLAKFAISLNERVEKEIDRVQSYFDSEEDESEDDKADS